MFRDSAAFRPRALFNAAAFRLLAHRAELISTFGYHRYRISKYRPLIVVLISFRGIVAEVSQLCAPYQRPCDRNLRRAANALQTRCRRTFDSIRYQRYDFEFHLVIFIMMDKARNGRGRTRSILPETVARSHDRNAHTTVTRRSFRPRTKLSNCTVNY